MGGVSFDDRKDEWLATSRTIARETLAGKSEVSIGGRCRNNRYITTASRHRAEFR
jgi:hypothetical protein